MKKQPATHPHIKTTLGALADAHAAIAAVLVLALPSTAAYHVMKLARLAEPEIQTFEAQRMALVKRLGVEVPETNGVQFRVDADKLPEYMRELSALRAVPIALPWGPITMGMLTGQHVSGQTLLNLGPLLSEGDV